MITLANGHKFEYMVASGALAFDGKGWPHEKYLLYPLSRLLSQINSSLKFFDPALFTVVAKTVTYKPRKGNFHLYCPWTCIRLIPDLFRTTGVVNAVGLTNKGIKWWAEKAGVSIDPQKIALVGSILSDNIAELTEMARIMDDFNLFALEINASCPNTGADLTGDTSRIIAGCEKVKGVTDLPLILKLSVAHNVREIVPYITGIVEAISINSVPWKLVFPNVKSPLAHLGNGGVSGKIVQKHTWRLVKELVGIGSIPVIGPSVWDFEDIEKLRKIGASAISFGSIFARYPWRPTLFIKKDMALRN